MHFTGSDRTGRIVMKRAADTLTPVSLELGGKDPAIVLADADIDRAANATAYGGFVNTGQVCMSIERIYVEEPVYDEFVGKLAANVGELRQGDDGRAYGMEQGAMTSPAQIEIVSDHVEDARDKGARILTGGKRKDGPGDWYEPTVIADADHSMKVMVDETFGPVVGVMKVADADEAIRMANDTRYGLSASVFAGDVKRGEQVAERLEVGACNVNDALVNYFHLEVPMGGWKDSGIGWRHGARRDPQVLPHRVDRHPAAAHRQVGAALVPVHAEAPQADEQALPGGQRPRPAQPARPRQALALIRGGPAAVAACDGFATSRRSHDQPITDDRPDGGCRRAVHRRVRLGR